MKLTCKGLRRNILSNRIKVRSAQTVGRIRCGRSLSQLDVVVGGRRRGGGGAGLLVVAGGLGVRGGGAPRGRREHPRVVIRARYYVCESFSS